ncbi:MAG: hypothetical protein L6Q29_00530 [Candidatus Pacebacteria bacterium]|nr:hypothetical protein [Candidatus Paceibacterota bacterium]NUQ57032.1 hypothetical protein [Candidatus Paceibacter sp.]
MSLIDKIENMQKKPDHVKRRIVFVSLFVIMFIIVAAWVSTLRLTTGESLKKETAVSSPFAVFKEMVEDGVAQMAGGLSDMAGSLDEAETNEAEITETEATAEEEINGEQQ